MQERAFVVWGLWFAGCAGPAGPAGPPGEAGLPSLSAVTPGVAYLERTLDVTISGSGTDLADPIVDLGEGIVVEDVRVASPTALVATLTVQADAALGPRDVVVSEGGVDHVFAGGLDVRAPLRLTELAGTAEQGGFLLARVDQLDLDTPFDTSLGGALTVLGQTAGRAFSDDLSPGSILGTFAVDVGATGWHDVTVDSVVGGEPVRSRAPAAFEVAPREPIALTPGEVWVGPAPVGELATTLLRFTGGVDEIATISVTQQSLAIDARPAFVVLPASGRFEDSLSSFRPEGSFRTVTGDARDFYVVVLDSQGTATYDVGVEVTSEPSRDADPANDTCEGAIELGDGGSLPVTVGGLGLLGDDEDWFRVDLVNQTGLALRASTSAGDPGTDTRVAIFAADCTTPLAASDDADFHDRATTGRLDVPGSTYVRVSRSPLGSSGVMYELAVELVEPPPETTDHEVEPNDELAEATAAAGDAVVGQGAIAPAGDVDHWAITPASSGWLTAEVVDGPQFGCDGEIDSELTLYDADGVVDFDDDIDWAGNFCSRVAGEVVAGETVWLAVRSSAQYSPLALFDYRLRVTVE